VAITIAVDAQGGDFGPSVTVPASLEFVAQQPDVRVILVGLQGALEDQLGRHPAPPDGRLVVRHATQVVEMDEPPALALRGKKDSSMRVAIDLVKSGEANACVSAGNTGALMATSRFVLKMMRGIERPAIAAKMPTMKGSTYVLDLGANVDCTAEHLLQFAHMGAMLVTAVQGNPRPSIGLLNIGHEAIKGGDTVKRAGELLRASGLNFHGNVEGDDIFKGTTDIVVCDGFVGNIALKTSEGVAQILAKILREEFSRNWMTKAAALCALPVLRSFRRRVDHRRYNGASLLGLRGCVVKSHGSADVVAFRSALQCARSEVGTDVVARIGSEMTSLEQQETS